MSPLEELEAAKLTHTQMATFIGILSAVVGDHPITRDDWSRAIKDAGGRK